MLKEFYEDNLPLSDYHNVLNITVSETLQNDVYKIVNNVPLTFSKTFEKNFNRICVTWVNHMEMPTK